MGKTCGPIRRALSGTDPKPMKRPLHSKSPGQDVLSSLRRIQTRTQRPDLRMFPDFLVLGPQRTGSTWLHANLVRHPSVRLHRDKETFYFSTLGRPDLPRFKYPYLEDYLESFKESPAELLKKNYSALRKSFRPYLPRITGESTASYSVLEPEVIGEITRIHPEMKAVLMIRHPFERAWSHAKKDLMRGREQAAPAEDFINFLKSPEQVARADYSAAIGRWTRFLKPGHFLVLPFDRILTNPEILVRKVEGFLEIGHCIRTGSRHLSSRQNPTADLRIPARYLAVLSEVLGPALDSFFELREKTGDGLVI